MRILTFLHSFEPGGVERVALRLVREWRKNGTAAPLFVGRTCGAMREELAADLDYHTPRLPPFAIHWCETIWMIVTLPAYIRRERPDALFCAGNSYTVIAVMMKLVLGRQCPPILAKISNDLNRQDMMWITRLLYRVWLRIQGRFIDQFVCMEESLEKEAADFVRPRPGSIMTIPDPALSIAQINELGATKRCSTNVHDRRFVAAGRLVAQKNFALMIRAFARGGWQGDRLVIYGDGPQRDRLSSLANELGVADRIEFSGHVPDLVSRLTDHDVFLLSSDYEGVPAVLLEALAAGLPIVATQCSCSVGPILANGGLGRMVPPRDEAAFARAISEVAADEQDRTASLIHARRFTIETASFEYVLAFDGMIGGRKRKSEAIN